MKRSSSQSNRKKDESSSVEENDDEKDESKRKSRNLSEKKRRDQFNMLINELCSMVSTTNRKMDKSSVLRSTIAFLRSHSEITVQSQSLEVQENWKPSFLSNEEFTHLMLEALDGFIIVLSASGKIMYTSESITSLLGYLPGDASGTIFDIVHESDKPSLQKLLSAATEVGDLNVMSCKGSCVSLLVHLKHGSSHHNESPHYELVRLVGMFHQLRPSLSEGTSHLETTSSDWAVCFVALARLQVPQLLREMTVSDGSKKEFTSRHSLEWKFLFLDHRAPPIIGYLPFEVLGTSGYDYYHVDDLEKVAECHEALMQTGEGTSCYYRFLTKGQQWIWLQTRYYITYHQWNSKPEFIVCTHAVISYEQVRESSRKEKLCSKVKNKQIKVEASEIVKDHISQEQNSSQNIQSSVSSRGSLCSCHSEISSENYQDSAKSFDDDPFKILSSTQADESSSDYPLTPSGNSASSTSTVMRFSEHLVELPTYPNDSQSMTSSSASQATNMAPSPLTPASSLSSTIGMDKTTLVSSSKSPQNLPAGEGESKCSSTIVLNMSQSQLQDYLRRRHQLLQQQIMLQQEELQRVSEQLMLVQFVTPSLTITATTVPLSHATSSLVSTQCSATMSPHVSFSQSDTSHAHSCNDAVLSRTVASLSISKPTLSMSSPQAASKGDPLPHYQQFFPHPEAQVGAASTVPYDQGCLSQHDSNIRGQ